MSIKCILQEQVPKDVVRETVFQAHTQDTDIHITSTERTNWNNKASNKHAAQHAKNGIDPITPSAIGAETAGAANNALTQAKNYTDEAVKISVETPVTLPETGYWKYAVGYNKSIAALDPVNGHAIYSQDNGITWQMFDIDVSSLTDSSVEWKGLVFLNGIYAAVGINSQTAILAIPASENLWRAREDILPPELIDMSAVTFNTDKIVIVNTAGEIYFSSNLYDWQVANATIEVSPCASLTYDAQTDQFYGVSPSPLYFTVLSSDLTNGVSYEIDDGTEDFDYAFVASRANQTIIVYGITDGSSTHIKYASYPSGADSWSDAVLTSANRNVIPQAIASFSNMWIIVGCGIGLTETKNMIYSTNGSAWSNGSMPVSANWSVLTVTTDRIIALAENDSELIAYSLNIPTWKTTVTEKVATKAYIDSSIQIAIQNAWEGSY